MNSEHACCNYLCTYLYILKIERNIHCGWAQIANNGQIKYRYLCRHQCTYFAFGWHFALIVTMLLQLLWNPFATHLWIYEFIWQNFGIRISLPNHSQFFSVFKKIAFLSAWCKEGNFQKFCVLSGFSVAEMISVWAFSKINILRERQKKKRKIFYQYCTYWALKASFLSDDVFIVSFQVFSYFCAFVFVYWCFSYFWTFDSNFINFYQRI